MAGTISLSLSQQFDNRGRPLAGGRLYFYAAGTSTPQNAFIDSDLTLPHPNPIILDDAGRVPQFFLADGLIKIRLTTFDGQVQIAADDILVVGPSSGGGGGGGGDDPISSFTTGDIKHRYTVGAVPGWVRCNGLTLGSATSGATERANADTESLFILLWTQNSSLAVSGGRGSSALGDFNANKTIVLPDFRGRTLAGLDNMGAGAASNLTATYFGTSATNLGAVGGSESHSLTGAETGPHTHAQTAQTPTFKYQNGTFSSGAQTAVDVLSTDGGGFTLTTNADPSPGNTASGGSGSAHKNVQPTALVTIYIKL
jgi:microcystin-dependent protein